MRLFEFEQLNEGGKSGPVRYNSEVGMLAGFMGIDVDAFDPKNPEATMSADFLHDAGSVFKDIKKLLAPNFDRAMFTKWANIGKIYQRAMVPKMTSLGTKVSKYGWQGGVNQNDEGAADVIFYGSNIQGISVKAEGGITLANLTPKSLGLTPEKGIDIFYTYASREFSEMKRKIFSEVLTVAKSQPGIPLAPLSDNYSVVYNEKNNTFTCKGKTSFTGTQEQIIANSVKNARWQRVFGDWFQANWAAKKSYATALFTKIAESFEHTIETHLKQNGKLANMLRFADVPYFYASSKNLYFVPSIKSVNDLEIRGIKYADPDGTSQLFIAQVARPDSEGVAEMDIYIRYANGMFESNPTVRIQNLKNPQFISWEKLV